MYNILIINWQDKKNPLAGGAEIYLHQIFERIAKMGNKITLLCCSFNGAKKEEFIDGIKIIRIGRRKNFNFYVPFVLPKLLKNEKYDLIIEDLNKIPFFTPLYIKNISRLILLMHLFGNSIYRETNIIFGAYVNFGERLITHFYKNEIFSVISNSTKQELVKKGIHSKNIYIISPAISNNIKANFSKKTKNPTLVVCGRIKKYKCIDFSLYAMKKLILSFNDVKLFIVGEGDYLPQLKKLAKKLNIEKNVEFIGFVPEHKKIEILQSAWLAINTSIKEGWGITNIEANACGTPVIASNTPGLKDSVIDGKTGFLVPHGDINLLAKKIIEIIQNKELREKLSKNAPLWAKNFSWDKAAKDMLNLIKNIVDKKNFKIKMSKYGFMGNF